MNTPDQTIALVKKWLDNPDSVSKEELKQAFYAAGATYAANAAYAAYHSDKYAAKKWVNEYEKLAHKEG